MGREVGKARGILRHAPAPGGEFHHARIAPASGLAGFVQHFWIVRWDLRGFPPQLRETLPHPNVHLTLAPGESRIYGVQTGRFTRVLEDRGGVFGVKFRPGGFHPFLRRPVSSLRDRTIPPRLLFHEAADALQADVSGASPDETAMVAAAERFLDAHRPPADPEVERVGAIVDEIAEDRSVTRVEQILERHGLQMRTLQRLFNEYVGVGPKWVINRYRLHEVVERLAEDRPVDWALLALDLGYFDQAHFIRDFKAMTGRTPSAYVAGEHGRRRGKRRT
ncbi:MAG: helix-turn-helix domain-containing protein [Luteitalea sp.]|nr:helix-turn-helix domain-containing protein [Luteitalea sp.]